MVRTLCEEGFAGDAVFLHYADAAADVPYLAELRALEERHENLRVVLAFTHEDGGDLDGRFGREHLDAVAPWVAEAHTFLCGPPPLMKSVRALYEAAGLTDRLHVEDFAPPSLTVVTDEATGDVSFRRSGVTAGNTGTTLLEQAEAAGLSPEYGCRMGICFSCTAVKKSGCTRNALTGAVDNDPDHEIQLCISVPVGDVAVDI
jgi:ferredoxin-NADP reductase